MLAPLVLVVDDFEDSREMYAEYLSFAGYRVEQASDGAEAVERVRELHPDLVVMDLALPALDGCEATRAVKENPDTRDVKVLVVTGHTLPTHLKRARDAGADDVLTKPLLPAELVAAVERLLESDGRARSANEAG